MSSKLGCLFLHRNWKFVDQCIIKICHRVHAEPGCRIPPWGTCCVTDEGQGSVRNQLHIDKAHILQWEVGGGQPHQGLQRKPGAVLPRASLCGVGRGAVEQGTRALSCFLPEASLEAPHPRATRLSQPCPQAAVAFWELSRSTAAPLSPGCMAQPGSAHQTPSGLIVMGNCPSYETLHLQNPSPATDGTDLMGE